MIEEWRETGMPGYLVSNLGNIKSLSWGNTGKERILKPILNKGYPRVTMRDNGRTVYRFPHRMVAKAWLGAPPASHEVRHKDGDRTNPRLDNLEYGTRADNIADCKRHGRFRNGASHLTEALVREISARSTENTLALAKEYKVSRSTIYGIWHGHVWKHLNLPIVHLRKSRQLSGPVL